MESKIRVLIISDTKGHDDEGMKKITRNLEERFLCFEEIDVTVATARDSLKIIKTFDILHCIGGPTYRSVLLIEWGKRKNNKLKTILTFSNPIWGAVADFLIRLFPPSLAIVSSQYWKNWAELSKIPYIVLRTSGIDPETFHPVSLEKKEQLRNKLKLPSDKKLVLHVGHLKYDRNLSFLKELQFHSSIQVIVVGSTTTKQSHRLMTDLTNAGCIILNTYQTHIEEYYQAADCYVFPTIDQEAAVQIPLSVLEAMATGIPVFSTRFGGLVDIYGDESGIQFFEAHEAGTLVDRIMELEKTSKVVTVNTEKLSWDSVATDLSNIYKTMYAK